MFKHTKNNPSVDAATEGSCYFRLTKPRLFLPLSIQPFTNIISNYTCRNGNKHTNMYIQGHHPLSVISVGKITIPLYN